MNSILTGHKGCIAAICALAGYPAMAIEPQGGAPGESVPSASGGEAPLADRSSAKPARPRQADTQSRQGPPRPQGPPQKPVFDETWATVGIGAGLVPSYAGSDDYVFFPLPVIAGRVGGVGISPNGPGFALDLFSPAPFFGQRSVRFSGGPAFRIRNDRADRIEDEVVERAEDLDLAIELGAQAGVAFPGVFNPRDTLSLTVQARADVAGAHGGVIIEPGIGYSRTFGRAVLFQANIGAEIVDDDFADYYFTVSPAQAAATGLPMFEGQGGLNRLGANAIVSVDLDGNALNGGLNIYTILGYSRLLGDGADTPFTAIRGDANQAIGAIGVGYTF